MFDFLNFLRKKYSEYNNNPVRQGTVIDELAVKPTGMLMSDFYNTLVEKQTQDNIENYADMTEDQMDNFGNKFFFPRQAGDKAFGVVRIWVDDAVDVTISTNFRAVSADNLLFPPASPRIVSKNSMVVSSDNYGKYYFDVNIIAEFAGTGYNKLANEIQSLINVDFSYKYVTNMKDLIPGSAHETNDLYYQRLKYSLNDRSLMNKRSLYAGLRDRFPYIYSIFAAGAGNKYMRRDRVQAVDLSNPPKEAKYLGKIAGDNIVRHTAYYDVFPAEAGSRGAAFAGPFSIYSNYDYPQTIDAVDLTNTDPAYHGYPLYQEATDEMYRGVYYDDFRNFYNVKTTDIFNISDQVLDAGVLQAPNNSWYYGSHGLGHGDFGIPNDSSLNNINLLSFTGLEVSLRGGTAKTVTTLVDVKKRIGMKVSGRFKLPVFSDTVLNSAVQVILAAPSTNATDGSVSIDSFSGIGVGVFVYAQLDAKVTTNPNATVFFSHSERHDSVYVFKDTSDTTFGSLGSIAESSARLQFGKEYSFEYVIYDDLTLSVRILPIEQTTDVDGFNNNETWTLESTVLNVYKNQIMDPDSIRYGTNLKLTLDTKSTSNNDTWTISDLKVVDLASHRPTALFMFNVDGLEEPLSIIFRGTGVGAVNNALQSGHSVYIWNLEVPGEVTGNTLLSSGGWQKLEDVSDPDGSKDIISSSLSQTLTGIDRYKISSRFGNVMVFMVVSEGESRASLTVNNDAVGDINAALTIDYIKLQDVQPDTYRGNNKCDAYINTIRNSDNFKSVTTTITRNDNEAYFSIDTEHGFEMPIVTIDTVTDSATNTLLDPSEYSIVRENINYLNSVKDKLILTSPNYTSLIISYSIYNHIDIIQDYFDGEEYGKVFGDVLVKHDFPTYLDFQISYAGTNTPDIIANAVRQYFDEKVGKVFDINLMTKYLQDNNYTTYIQQPVTVSYERITDLGKTETGSFTTTYTLDDINFFRVRNVLASQL